MKAKVYVGSAYRTAQKEAMVRMAYENMLTLLGVAIMTYVLTCTSVGAWWLKVCGTALDMWLY